MFGAVPQTGSYRTLAPHPACGHLPPKGEGSKTGRLPSKGKAFAYDKKGVTQLNTEKVISRDNDYILHTYGRSQIVLAEGEGMTARDADGKSYLDFTSGIGVNSLGYCHPAWVRAVADQAATLQHTSCITPPPTASWRKSSAAAPGWTPCSSATRAPRPTRARSSAPANTA